MTHGISTRLSSALALPSATCGARSISSGDVLDVPIQSRRNALAASGFFRKLSRLKYVPRVIVSDKLESYQVAHRDALASVKHNAIPVLEQLGRTRTQPT